MRTTIFCYLLLFSVKGQILKFVDEDPEILKDSETVTHDWEHLENLLKNFVKQSLKSLMPSLTSGMSNLNVSSSCMRDTIQLLGGMQKLKSWAMRFLDSTAKGLDGMLAGTFFSVGSYDECVETLAYDQRTGKSKGDVMFTGQYCTLRVRPHLPKEQTVFRTGKIVMKELEGIHKRGTILSELAEMAPLFYSVSYRIGICVPSGCSKNDLNNVFGLASDYTKMHMTVKRCEVKEKPKYTPTKIFVMSLYSFAGFLVVLGTLTDAYYYYFGKDTPKRTPVRVLLAFSLKSNFKKLFNTSTSSQSLRCLNGIRFLTMSWVILQHSYLLVLFQVVNSMVYVRDMVQDFAFQVVSLPSVCVDTFFVLGGFLVCYITTTHVVIGKGKLNILVYILHRLWRILPVLIFVVLYMFIAELAVSGPLADHTFKPFIEGCENNWWATLLFINNYYKPTEPCMTHSWYLSMDMQLYIAALFILLPLFRWPKVGLGLAVGTIGLSIVVSGIVIYVKNFPPTFIVPDANAKLWANYLTEFYFKPYSHVGPYVIGMLAGYLLVMNPDLKIPKKIQVIGWFCSTLFATAPLYGTHEWNNGRDPTVLETIFYASCHRIGWALSISWVIICCATGHGGIVNHILSWKLWIPLGRLTYMAYLVHFIVQISFVALFRHTVAPVHALGVWLFFGHLVVTYGISLFGAMLIESPFMALEKLFLPQRGSPNGKEKENNYPVEEFKKENIRNGSRNATVSGDGVENRVVVCRL